MKRDECNSYSAVKLLSACTYLIFYHNILKPPLLLLPLFLHVTIFFNLFSFPSHFPHITQSLYFPSSPLSHLTTILHPLTFTPLLLLSYVICKPLVVTTFSSFPIFSTYQRFLILFLPYLPLSILLHHLIPILTSDVSPFSVFPPSPSSKFYYYLQCKVTWYRYCLTSYRETMHNDDF